MVASERLAEAFAVELRADLWARPFDHPDPVHHAPTDVEMSLIPLWEKMDKTERFRFVRLMLNAPYGFRPELLEMPLTDRQRRFLQGIAARTEPNRPDGSAE